MFESRLMTLEDVTTIAEIESSATAFPWTAKLFKDCIRAGHHCQIYYNDQSPIIAYTIIQQIMDETHLLNICVSPEHQGVGYGSKVIEKVGLFAKQQTSTILLLEVRLSNFRAQSLYQKAGFNEISVRRGYYPAEKGREDAVLMGLMLF